MKKLKNKNGFSFIDVIVGISLMVVVFAALFGVFRLGLESAFNNKAKIGAISLANEQMEFIRSLSYKDVGTIGGIPNGIIEAEENIALNGISYTRRTFIKYIDDIKDGEGENDENGIIADYKQIRVNISWISHSKNKSYVLITNIVPKGMESIDGGGTLEINIFNALGLPVVGASVLIENSNINPNISVEAFTNTNGKVIFPGSPAGSNYEITVSKDGYSIAKTYSIEGENVNPNPAHLTVSEGTKTSASFAIDLLANKTIKTFSAITDGFWNDLFNDEGSVSEIKNVKIEKGELLLASTTISTTGYAFSVSVNPDYLSEYTEISFNDTKPNNTEIIYQVYYKNSSDIYVLIPDKILFLNSKGYTESPIDISNLNIETYNNLKIKATLNTSDISVSPSIQDWKITYLYGPNPLPNIQFNMHGNKNIGTRKDGSVIYKYEENLQTYSNGIRELNNLEYDNYTITIDNDALNFDISEICKTQPFSLEPSANVITEIILSPYSKNSLLIAITDSKGKLLENVSVRLYSDSFDGKQKTSSCGQTFFSNLKKGTVLFGNPYAIDISLTGYEDKTVKEVDVDGASNIIINFD